MIRPHGAVLPTRMGIVEILTELSKAICLLVKMKLLNSKTKGVCVLKDMENSDLTICSDYLEQVKAINTDKALSNEERLTACIDKLSNPYCLSCGKTIVKVVFNEDAPTLDFCLINYFKSLKSY